MTLLDFMLMGGMVAGIWFSIAPNAIEDSPMLFRAAAVTLACSSAIVIGMRL